MNGSLGTLLPSSVPSSLSSAVTSPEDERRCAPFSVGDEHAAVSRAASPAPIKVLLSTLVGSCPLPGLLWLVEAWSVIIEGVSLSVLRDPMPGRWEGEPSSASQIRGGVGVRRQSELKQSCCSGAVPISVTVGCSGVLRNAENCLTGPVVKRGATVYQQADQRTMRSALSSRERKRSQSLLASRLRYRTAALTIHPPSAPTAAP